MEFSPPIRPSSTFWKKIISTLLARQFGGKLGIDRSHLMGLTKCRLQPCIQDSLYIFTACSVINIGMRRTLFEWVDIKLCYIQRLTLYDSSRKWTLFNSFLTCLVFKLLMLISSSHKLTSEFDLRKLKRLELLVNFLDVSVDFSSKYSLSCFVKDLRFGLSTGSVFCPGGVSFDSGVFRFTLVLTNLRSLKDRFRLMPGLSKVNWFCAVTISSQICSSISIVASLMGL